MTQPAKPVPPQRSHADSPRRLGRIHFVPDGELSRQKLISLNRLVNTFRTFAELRLLAANTTEAKLLELLSSSSPELVLLPWKLYLTWSKIEGFFGLTRASGPTVAGYHCGMLPNELGPTADFSRAILLDFGSMHAPESAILVRSLLVDRRRSGIVPLIAPLSEPGQKNPVTVYFDPWHENEKLGFRLDAALALPSLNEQGWQPRANVIRLLIGSLWSLIFEEMPEVREFRKAPNAPRAVFQIGFTEQCLAMRLCYGTCATTPITPRDALNQFWPDADSPSSAKEILLRHSELLRVHSIPNTSRIELVVALFRSGASMRLPDRLRNLWIEPLDNRLFVEAELPGGGGSAPAHLVPLRSSASPSDSTPHPASHRADAAAAARFAEARAKMQATIEELRIELADREALIAELKRGGVGAPRSIAPPDVDSLLQALSDRFLIAHDQLIALSDRIRRLSARRSADSVIALPELRHFRQQLSDLRAREENWVRSLAELIRVYQEDRHRFGKAG